MDPSVDVGTVINEAAAMLFERRVADARREGRRASPWQRPRDGALFPPTVVDRVPYDCELVHQETFGPVIPIIRVPGRRSTRSSASRTRPPTACRRACAPTASITSRASSSELEVGTVNIWEVPGYRIEMSPFGGIKDSGLGYKEGVVEAMKSFTNVRTWSMPFG